MPGDRYFEQSGGNRSMTLPGLQGHMDREFRKLWKRIQGSDPINPDPDVLSFDYPGNVNPGSNVDSPVWKVPYNIRFSQLVTTLRVQSSSAYTIRLNVNNVFVHSAVFGPSLTEDTFIVNIFVAAGSRVYSRVNANAGGSGVALAACYQFFPAIDPETT